MFEAISVELETLNTEVNIVIIFPIIRYNFILIVKDVTQKLYVNIAGRNKT